MGQSKAGAQGLWECGPSLGMEEQRGEELG